VQTGYDRITDSLSSLLMIMDQTTGSTERWGKVVNSIGDGFEHINRLLLVSREEADQLMLKQAQDYAKSLTPEGQALTKGAFGQEPTSEGQARFNSMMNRMLRQFFPGAAGTVPPAPEGPLKFFGGSIQGGDWDSSSFMKSGEDWSWMRRSDNIEDRRDLEDNTEQTKSLTEQLKTLNDMLSAPGSAAAALGLAGGGGAGGGGDGYGGGGGTVPRMYQRGGGGGGGDASNDQPVETLAEQRAKYIKDISRSRRCGMKAGCDPILSSCSTTRRCAA
jgi:hypothetical protein